VLIFIKLMGLTAVGGSLTIWWWMVAGILKGEIEATTRGAGEVWFSRMDSPTAFWVTVAVYFIGGLLFLWLGYCVLRKDNVPPSGK
jgi:hypothetical protein